MRRTLKISLVVIPLLLVLVVALPVFLAGTQAGTRLLAGQFQRRAGDLLHWERLDGRLAGPLRIRGLRVRAPGLAVDVADLQLDWSPTALLGGTLAVEELVVAHVRVAIEPGEETPPTDAAPLLPSALRPPVDIRLDRLDVSDLELRSGETRQAIDRLELSARLEDGALALPRLQVSAPEGGITAHGEGTLEDDLPLSLDAHWDWKLADGRQLGGTLAARGNLHELAISHRGESDLPLNVQGTLLDLLGQPGWALDIDWPQLALPGSEQPLVLEPGRLHTEGNLAGYRIEGAGAVSGLAPEPVSWSLAATGDGVSLQLAPLQLANGPGAIVLSGRLDWSGPIAADLEYHAWGDGLDAINPELPPRLDARGHIGAHYADETAVLEGFDLALEQSPLTLTLRGTASLPASAEPQFDGELGWSQLQWPLGADTAAFASGKGALQLAGMPSDYRLSMDADVSGTQVPSGQWHADANGDTGQLRLQALLGETLGGELKLSGELAWAPALRWELRADGERLDPGQWLPDLPGSIALALHTEGVIDPTRGPQGAVEVEQVSGVLAGRDLQLRARARLAGERLALEDLQLDSGGNTIAANGSLAPDALALDWQLQLPSPDALVPGMAGRLQAKGTVSGSASAPRLEASVEGHALALDAYTAELLQLQLEAGLTADAPLRLDLVVEQVVEQVAGEGTPRLQRAAVTARGTTGAHSIDLAFDAPADALRARLEGGLDAAEGSWQGQLATVYATSEGYGNWQLAAPADLRLSAATARLGEGCLQEEGEPTRICAGADWASGGSTHLAAQLRALPLGRFLPGVAGQFDGVLTGVLAADGALAGDASFAISPGEMRLETAQGAKSIAFGGGIATGRIDASGLTAQLVLEGDRQRLIDAAIELPGLNRLPLPAPQPLAGHIRANVDDLSGLQALVPELGPTAGNLHADLQLAGTLDEPRLLGEFALREASADIPVAGLQLRDIELQARGDPQQPGVLALTGGVASGPGRLDLDGSFDMATGALELRLLGDRILVYNTPDARAQLSPDLRVGWDGETLKLRGRVAVPEADITPRLSLNPATMAQGDEAPAAPGTLIAPSPDVVVIGVEGEAREAPEPALPFRLDSRIEVALGKRVNVNTVGFIARVAGDVTFTNLPDSKELVPTAKGRLSIEDGTFRAFGQDLQIETGDVDFDGGPVTEPEITVRAVRWIDNDPAVSAAGLMISGKAAQPVLVLFSRPQLDPSEIQSYLLTGRGLRDKDSVLRIGTYIRPKIYVGYGYNTLTETSEFNTLYTITPRYGIEATAGEADNSLYMTITYEH